jgi:peroxiredoxin
LADFQSRISDFDERKIKVIAASADSLEDARKSVERKNLTFPVAYGLDARAFAAQTGAFFDDVRGYIDATGFILRPDGKVDEAVYSTGPIGRFVSADTLFLIDYRTKKAS